MGTGEKTRSVANRGPTKLALPNPQGKGQVGFLLDWHYSSPKKVAAKAPGQVLADYFTSMLVLSADFKFRPVFETDYYLYRSDKGWALSLLSPEDWQSAEKRSAFVGRCTLHDDSTWSISPSENLSRPGPVADAIADFYAAFVDKLDVAPALESGLPFFEGNLPYYQRLFATALSRSLELSLRAGGQSGVASRAWLSQLPDSGTRLLGSAPASDRNLTRPET